MRKERKKDLCDTERVLQENIDREKKPDVQGETSVYAGS